MYVVVDPRIRDFLHECLNRGPGPRDTTGHLTRRGEHRHRIIANKFRRLEPTLSPSPDEAFPGQGKSRDFSLGEEGEKRGWPYGAGGDLIRLDVDNGLVSLTSCPRNQGEITPLTTYVSDALSDRADSFLPPAFAGLPSRPWECAPCRPQANPLASRPMRGRRSF